MHNALLSSARLTTVSRHYYPPSLFSCTPPLPVVVRALPLIQRSSPTYSRIGRWTKIRDGWASSSPVAVFFTVAATVRLTSEAGSVFGIGIASSSSATAAGAAGSTCEESKLRLPVLRRSATVAAVAGSIVVQEVSKVAEMGAEGGKKGDIIALFDVDGTLTPARKEASAEMLQFLQDLRKVVTVGVVGGSDLVKISEQLGKNTIFDYDYVFSENGLVAYKQGKLIGNQSLVSYLGEEKLKKFVNFVLHYIADLDIPIKRGTFVEFRMGMLNVSPIGRNCSYEERIEFEKYDKVHNIRSKFVEILTEKFVDYNLKYSIGGQISFDVFPQGWDKTFCLSFVEKEFSVIHFFGDKTYKGGNDHEIFESVKTIGHTVTSPEDTRSQCTKLFLS